MTTSRMRRGREGGGEVLLGASGGELKGTRGGFGAGTGGGRRAELRHEGVYVSVLGSSDERQAALDGLQSSAGFLQAKVGEELRMKRTPTLEFEYDDSIDRGMRISELLDKESGEWE